MASAKPVWVWAGLLLLSAGLGAALEAARFPAAFLLGPMLVAIGFGLRGAKVRVPGWAFVGGQALTGLLVARALDPRILDTLQHDWLPIIAVVFVTILASAFVGWLLVRTGSLPGTTAAWGSSPGAASGMVAMAEEFGADPRLVAFMQYLRVTVVVIVAASMTHFGFGSSTLGTAAVGAPTTMPLDQQALRLAETLAIGIGGAWIGKILRIPSGAVFVPMLIGAVLQGMGLVVLFLPQWLLAAGFAAIGWYVGLRFERETTLYALRAIPYMLMGIGALIGLCGLSAAGLVWVLEIDPLTAYLATSPGGLDSVAIIAVGTTANLSFVMAVQTVRLFVVMVTGPIVAKLISRAA